MVYCVHHQALSVARFCRADQLATADTCLFYREGLQKIRDAYEQNPRLGDAATVMEQLDESSHTVDQLLADINKYEVRGRVFSAKL